MGSPSRAVNPMVLSMLRPPASAHMEAPLPRCATITRPFATSGANFTQTGRDILIRKPVKSIPPDAFAIELFRNCIVIDNSTVRTVECRIETGDLDQSGPKCQQGPYHREIVGLMQRCERNILLQTRKHVFVDQNGSVEVRPAMNDAMTDCD